LHRKGDVYAKIIEEVIATSTTDFEESGVGQTTLSEMQQVRNALLSFIHHSQSCTMFPPLRNTVPGRMCIHHSSSITLESGQFAQRCD
jgi:hypothetical protein